jgi:hypothetical protein
VGLAEATEESEIPFGLIDGIINKTEFYYDDIGLKECYSEYISIWEVKSDGLQLHEGWD